MRNLIDWTKFTGALQVLAKLVGQLLSWIAERQDTTESVCSDHEARIAALEFTTYGAESDGQREARSLEAARRAGAAADAGEGGGHEGDDEDADGARGPGS